MTVSLTDRLSELGLELPQTAAPAANYVSYVVDGKTLWLSGQLPFEAGQLITGKLGADLDLAQGHRAAQLCALGLIAQVNAALDGEIARLDRVLKLVGFVNSTPDFIDQPKVINGASDLMVQVFGDAGRHARSAVSAGSLPLGAAVEVEAVVRLL